MKTLKQRAGVANPALFLAKGFTLVELMVVLGIISIMTILAIPPFAAALRASGLTSGGRELVDQLNYARQTARTRNRPVEVRLYRLPDYNRPATDPVVVYRGFQSFMIDKDGSYVALGKPEYLQSPVIISTGVAESSLFTDMSLNQGSHLEQNPKTTSPQGIGLGDYGQNYKYLAFQFTPAGLTDLSAGENFITLILQNGPAVAQGANFFTIQIDAVNGGVRSFRP